MTTVFGTRKSDLLHDGPDSTTFYGKGGFDVFHFNDLAVDKIKDFNVNKDTIVVSHLAFVPFVQTGEAIEDGVLQPTFGPVRPTPTSFNLVYGGKNSAEDVSFIYNKHNGRLWYDFDGDGGYGAILIAKIGKGLALSEDNLVIV